MGQQGEKDQRPGSNSELTLYRRVSATSYRSQSRSFVPNRNQVLYKIGDEGSRLGPIACGWNSVVVVSRWSFFPCRPILWAVEFFTVISSLYQLTTTLWCIVNFFQIYTTYRFEIPQSSVLEQTNMYAVEAHSCVNTDSKINLMSHM